jgi:hypothetical protein
MQNDFETAPDTPEWTMPSRKNLRSRIMYIENKGSGFKSNYYDVDTGEHYWISGVKKDQNDRLYGGNKGVVIDEDVKDEYDKLINGTRT